MNNNTSQILEEINQLNREVVKLAGEGDIKQAISITKKTIKLTREKIGEHPALADSLNNLAELYRIQANYADAQPLLIESIEMRKRLLGENHPDVAQSLNNLAAFYVIQGNYSEAEDYFFQALHLWKIHLGEEHEEIATILNNIAEVYREQGRYAESEKMHIKALNMRKSLFGEKHDDIAQSLDNLAVIYENQARYQDAETMHLEALAMRKKFFGEEHWNVAASLNNLAALYDSQGRFTEAEDYYTQAFELCKKCLGNDEHPYVAIILNNLGGISENLGRYADAEKIHLQALEIRKAIFGKEHLEVAQSLNNLGNVYLLQGLYLKAEEVYQQAYEIRKLFLDPEHPDNIQLLHNFAVLYTYQGRYQAAESICLKTLDSIEKAYGKNHPNYADNLNHLALVYQKQGNYSQAEQKYLTALAIRKNIFGEEHHDIVKSLNRIAEIYRLQGRYSQAEAIYKENYQLAKRLLGEMHPDVAGILNSLAVLYDAQFKYAEAEKLFTEVLLIIRSQFGNNHPQVATTLNNLATVIGSLERFSEAEELHLQVLEIRKNIFGEEHPDITNSYNNLAEIYLAQGKYAEAEKYYNLALSLRKQLLGENHPDVAFSLNNLSTLYAAIKRYQDALSYRIQASHIHDKLISNVFAFSSENDRLAFIDRIRGSFDLFLSLIYQYLPNSQQAINSAFDFILKRKGLSATSLTAQNQAFYNGKYPHLTEKFQQLRELSNQIIHLTITDSQTQNLDNYKTNLNQLQTQYDNLQKQIATQVPEIQSQQIPNREAVASALPANSVLIEFVQIDVFDFQAIRAKRETQWRSPRYLAFILPVGKPDAVQMVDLGEVGKIDELISKFCLQVSDANTQTLGFKKSIPVKPKLQIKQYNPSDSIQLSKLILAPILEKIDNDYQKIIFAADGNLNSVPLQILPIDETGKRLLMDKYTVSYLGVGRDILRSGDDISYIADKPIVIADPDFELSAPNQSQQQKQPLTKEFIDTFDSQNLNRTISTKLLGETVAKKLEEAQLYTGKQALEIHLTNGKCPQIMLIATHGLFLPDTKQVSNPMMRSALALAGAKTWLSGGILPENAGKGIVFAQDIANLDLRANQLTVLSACNTARGDIKIGEGVFGLRRAFAVAGTKSLVMSLWEVPDRTSALLMERFFNNYQAGMDAVEALQNAQNYIRNITVKELRKSALGVEILKEILKLRELPAQTQIDCRDDDKPLAHPFYWGAWVCQN
ncbi:MAG: CHAT domain-containing protein [Rivularia sp. (in: Bacteria)]|nr:CHAT domain-containing protein [Rivularia sp. MS3]